MEEFPGWVLGLGLMMLVTAGCICQDRNSRVVYKTLLCIIKSLSNPRDRKGSFALSP
jgi:hypothetical protein